MKWYSKLFISLVLAVFLFGVVALCYAVWAKYQMNDYTLNAALPFNAAMMVNATETYTDDENAVIVEYDGARIVVAPENYRRLSAMLRQQISVPPFARVPEDCAMRIFVCGDTVFSLSPDGDGNGFLSHLETAGISQTVHIEGNDLWNKLVKLCTEGSSTAENIVIE